MKKVILSIALLFSLFSVTAQNAAYEKAMTDLVAQIQQLPFDQITQPLTNKMERIAAAEPTEWLPNYWVAYCYTTDSFKKQDSGERDQLLDLAETFIAKAEKLSLLNAEIEVMKAQIASGRLSIDPMNRYQTYGEKFAAALAKAEKLNAENPRVQYLKGTSAFYTPENFGGGKAVAKPLLEKALEKFNNFELESPMHPNWGKVESQYFLSQCQ